MKKIVFILGTGHCGSTLLDLLLGSHSSALSLGEVYTLINKKPSAQLCDFCETDCNIWSQDLHQKLLLAYNPNLLERVKINLGIKSETEVQFYDAIIEKTKKTLLIDSSKNPGWIIRNGRILDRKKEYKPILLYLSRDGRAVINSYHRKYQERGLEKIAHNWNKRISKINNCYENWPNDYKVHISYENLAKNPVETIKNILSFINEDYEESMMRFWEHQHHLLNGNAGTKSMVLKFQEKHRHTNWLENNKKGQYYKNHELGIKFDERWRKELTKAELKKIEPIIYNYNQNLKFEN